MDKKSLPEIIYGKKISLKSHNEDLADTMFKVIDQDRKRLKIFLPWVDATQSSQDSLAYIKMTKQWRAECTMFDYGIFELNSNQFIGSCGVHNINWENSRAELGYWLVEKFEGLGLMSETVQLLEDVLFQAGFTCVEIRCSSKNERSSRLPKRNGYILEKTIEKDFIENGDYRDTLVFCKYKK